jgi:tRNA threonylcarbamoyladenosine biosynthesis protein TsaE
MQPRQHTDSPAATEALGEELARDLEPGDLVLLEGELASGKTTLVRGLLRGLGGAGEEVTSPTFVLVQSYPCSRPGIRVLHHVDLYRVPGGGAALREIGVEELLSEADAVVAVEWPPATLVDWLPRGGRSWHVRLETTGESGRLVDVAVADTA